MAEHSCLCTDKRININDLAPKSLLCVGGSRSGKSDFALEYAQSFQGIKAFVATMQKTFTLPAENPEESPKDNPCHAESAQDEEVAKRIQKHRAQRDESWQTIEEPYNLVQALQKAEEQNCTLILIDCISLWLSNLIFAEKSEEEIIAETEKLAQAIEKTQIPVILVSNEVGTGIVPMYASARLFRDVQGKSNQILAKACEAVVHVMYGLPILLKG